MPKLPPIDKKARRKRTDERFASQRAKRKTESERKKQKATEAGMDTYEVEPLNASTQVVNVSPPPQSEFQPWDKLPEENDKEFQWFRIYRDLIYDHGKPKRTANAAESVYRDKRVAKPSEQWTDARKKFNWDERAAAYDRYMDDRKAEYLAVTQAEVAARHLEIARDLQQVAKTAIQEMKEAQDQGKLRLKPSDVIKLAQVSVQMEQGALEQAQKAINKKQLTEGKKSWSDMMAQVEKEASGGPKS